MDNTFLGSNLFIDDVEAYTTTPNPEDVGQLRDPQDYMIKLNEIASPTDRLIMLAKSVITPWTQPTHEAYHIRTSGGLGLMVGTLFGGFLNNKHNHEDYVRRHNASVFEGQFRGNRHFWDFFISSVMAKGLKTGFRTACLTTSASVIAFSSIVYRNELYQPDWLIGFAGLGGLSRLWIGTRGVAAGALLGLCAGFAGYGLARSIETMSGSNVSELGYRHHVEWVSRREQERRFNQIKHYDMQEKMIREAD